MYPRAEPDPDLEPRACGSIPAFPLARLPMRFVHLFPSAHARPGLWRAFATLALCLLLASCASVQRANKNESLRKLQYDYSAAIRWGDFENAWNAVDPDYRKSNPLSEAEFSRYAQMQVTAYREQDTITAEDGVVLRNVQIDVVNRNTLSQRSVRYIEKWRWDEDAGRWWIVGGLPDFWSGQ